MDNYNTKVKVSKTSRGLNYVKAKFVVVISADTSIGDIRKAATAALAKRWEHFEERVQLFSVPFELENHSDSAPLVIIVNTSYRDVKSIPEAEEKRDKEFLEELTKELNGWYPKIYYNQK